MANEKRRGHLHKINFGVVKQVTGIGDPTTQPTKDLNLSVGATGISPPGHDFDVRPREDVGGNEFAETTDVYKEMWDWSDTFEMDTVVAAWILAFTMGEVTLSGAGPFIADFLLTTANQLPVTGIALEGHFGKVIQYNDLFFESFNITGSGEGDQTVQIAFTVKATGDREVDPGAYTLPSLTKAARMRMGKFKFEIGDAGGALFDLSDQVLGFNFGLTNNTFEGYRPSGNLRRVRAERGNKRTFDFNIQLEQAANDYISEVSNRQLMQSKLTIFDDFSAAADFLEITIPQFNIASALPEGDEELRVPLTTILRHDPDGAGYDVADQGSFKAQISRTNAFPVNGSGTPETLLGDMNVV